MNLKNYHARLNDKDQLEHLRIQDHHPQTQQKFNKYYSNNDDITIKKKLIDHYEKVPSTHDSNYQHSNDTLLNQLHQSIQSYRPVFKDATSKKRPNYNCLNLQIEKPIIMPTIQQEMPFINEPQTINFTKIQQQHSKNHISRFDRQISALYKQNRNVNLQYRKHKFMQIFLKGQKN